MLLEIVVFSLMVRLNLRSRIPTLRPKTLEIVEEASNRAATGTAMAVVVATNQEEEASPSHKLHHMETSINRLTLFQP